MWRQALTRGPWENPNLPVSKCHPRVANDQSRLLREDPRAALPRRPYPQDLICHWKDPASIVVEDFWLEEGERIDARARCI